MHLTCFTVQHAPYMLHSSRHLTYFTVQQAPYILHSTAGGMAFLINIGYTTTSLVNQLIADEVLTLVAKFTIIPVAVFIEFPISMYTVKNNYSTSQKCEGCKCSSLKGYLLLSTHVFALWNILTTLQLFCMTVIRAATDPPTSDYPLHNYFATITCWCHTHCCLHTALVSEAKKWFSEQGKVLWKHVFVLCCDYCNCWTHCHTA